MRTGRRYASAPEGSTLLCQLGVIMLSRLRGPMQSRQIIPRVSRSTELLALLFAACFAAIRVSAAERALFSATPLNDLGTGPYLGFEGGRALSGWG